MVLDESCLLELMERVYASAADGDWRPALGALLPVFRAEAGDVLIQEDLIGASEGLEADVIEDYSRYYWRLDDRRRRAGDRLGEVLTNSRMGLKDSEVERSEFYQDFSRRCHSFYALGFSFELEREILSISLHRMRPQGEFDEGEVGALNRLKPHVLRAAHLSRRLLFARNALGDAHDALELLPSALVLLDSRSRPTFVNRAARRILRSRDGLWLDRDGLRAATVALTSRLRGLIASASLLSTARGLGGGGVLQLARPSGAPALSALAVPLAAPALLSAKTRATVALFLRDPATEPLQSGVRLQQLYGLTPAEARLASRLAAGEPLDAAAAGLGVARETVRSQLRAIFQKTGTRRQGELLRKLALDAVMLPEPPSEECT